MIGYHILVSLNVIRTVGIPNINLGGINAVRGKLLAFALTALSFVRDKPQLFTGKDILPSIF